MIAARLLPGVVLALAVAVSPAAANETPSAIAANGAQIPLIGVDGPDQDACVGIGRVSMFGMRGRSALPIREKPTRFAKQSGEVEPGELVWLCEVVGDFQGIVYAEQDFQELGDCRLGRTLPEPEPYSGPCATGWVEASQLQLVTDK